MINILFLKFKNNNSGNSFLVTFLFFFIITFQLTGLKFIWGIDTLSRVLNTVVLILLFGLVAVALQKKYHQSIWYYYIIPGLMVLSGLLINITISCFSDISNVNLLGTTFPWLLYLIIPYFVKHKSIKLEILWKWFYYFTIIFLLLGFYDFFVFAQLSGLKVLTTPFGNFLGGRFSWMFMTTDGTPHFRFYGCFYEPGTLAMFLLPAIAYAFFKKHYFGLIPLLIAFYLTYSLGGVFSLILLTIVIIFKSIAKSTKSFIISILIIGILSSIFFSYTATSLKEEYNDRGTSAAAREEGISKLFNNLPNLIFNYPLGIPYSSITDKLVKESAYSGSNFILGNYIQLGGIISMIGIIIILFVSIRISIRGLMDLKSNLDSKIIFSSLIVLVPFIFQRSTIWDSALFGLMFSPIILLAITNSNTLNLEEKNIITTDSLQ